MMRTDRPGARPSTGPSWAGDLTRDEMLALLDGYLAYWGTYEVDEVKRLITIHIEGCLRPGWIGVDQHRYYEVAPDRRHRPDLQRPRRRAPADVAQAVDAASRRIPREADLY